MHLKASLTKLLKIIAADMRQSIVALILGTAILAGGGLLYLSKTVLSFFLLLLNTPIPVGATIAVVLLLGLYVRLKCKNIQSSIGPLYPACGVLWDSKFNMYCLSCKKPLKNSTISPSLFFCSDPKCNSKYPLKDNPGRDITKQEAVEIIKSSHNQANAADAKSRAAD